VDAAIANVQPVHDAISYRRVALDDPSTHHGQMVTECTAGNARPDTANSKRALVEHQCLLSPILSPMIGIFSFFLAPH
jgi:hypothetical protein